MCEIHQGPGAETPPNQRPDICLQLTCPVTETTPCYAERTIYALDSRNPWIWLHGPVLVAHRHLPRPVQLLDVPCVLIPWCGRVRDL